MVTFFQQSPQQAIFLWKRLIFKPHPVVSNIIAMFLCLWHCLELMLECVFQLFIKLQLLCVSIYFKADIGFLRFPSCSKVWEHKKIKKKEYFKPHYSSFQINHSLQFTTISVVLNISLSMLNLLHQSLLERITLHSNSQIIEY